MRYIDVYNNLKKIRKTAVNSMVKSLDTSIDGFPLEIPFSERSWLRILKKCIMLTTGADKLASCHNNNWNPKLIESDYMVMDTTVR